MTSSTAPTLPGARPFMLYNTEAIPEAPTSWAALLDEQYSGRIATWNAPIQIAQYALLLDPRSG